MHLNHFLQKYFDPISFPYLPARAAAHRGELLLRGVAEVVKLLEHVPVRGVEDELLVAPGDGDVVGGP